MEKPLSCPKCGRPLGAQTVAGLCPQCLLQAGLGTGSQPASPGFTPPPAEVLQPHFPHLEILGVLGQGGMGAVYKARQPALDRLVALKILPLNAARDPGFAERFAREARALAKLNHPHIVAVYDYGQAGDFLYFLMEFVDGANLRQIERAGKLAPREALLIIPQICDALQYAHDAGVVHRDIKPENVLLDKQGRVKIADFGLAKILGLDRPEGAITAAYHALGTPHYMAPEQVERPLVVDHRADIYSLGVVFYEMLTGELPLGRFAAPSRKAAVDARLDDVVLRTLEKEPAARYQHASEVKTDVETIADTRGVAPPARPVSAAAATPPGRSPSKWRTAGRVIYASLLTFVVGLVGLRLYGEWREPEYTATASVEVLREQPQAITGAKVHNAVTTPEDFNTRVHLMESAVMVQEVSARLKEGERKDLLAPYRVPPDGGPTVEQVLLRGRVVTPLPSSLIVQVSFTHPNPLIAAKIANLFAEESIASTMRQNSDHLARFIQDLDKRAREQKAQVERLDQERNAMLETFGFAPLADESSQRAESEEARAEVTAARRELEARENAWRQTEEYVREGKPLWGLAGIATQPGVAESLAKYNEASRALIRNADRYGDNHPAMVLLNQTLAIERKLLEEAVAAAVERQRTELDAARLKFSRAQEAYEALTQRNLELAKVKVRYETLLRDLKVAEGGYYELFSALEDRKNQFELTAAPYRLLDRAWEPTEPNPWLSPPLVAALAAASVLSGGLLVFLAGAVSAARHAPQA